MKKVLFLFFIIFTFHSCGFFDTEKISSETFYKEDLQTINWKDVDNYPLFKKCETLSEKEEQKSCFEITLASKIYQNISLDSIRLTQDLKAKVKVQFSISNKGILFIDTIELDSITQNSLPFLKTRILKSIDSMQLVAPAYKRGIPVQTSFVLPIVIGTEL